MWWFSAPRYICDDPGEALHVRHGTVVAQLDSPLVELSCAAPARGHALTLEIHHPELADGVGIILSRSLLEPWPCMLPIHSDTAAVAVHERYLPLAQSVTPLRTDLIRRQRPWVVLRHAFAPVVDVGDGLSC